MRPDVVREIAPRYSDPGFVDRHPVTSNSPSWRYFIELRTHSVKAYFAFFLQTPLLDRLQLVHLASDVTEVILGYWRSVLIDKIQIT